MTTDKEPAWGIVVETHDGRRIVVPPDETRALLDRAAAAIAEHYLATTTDRLVSDALDNDGPRQS